MSSPLFNILERNLGVPDVDKGDVVQCLKKQGRKRRGKTSQKVIDAWLMANELVKSGMNKSQASKEAGFRHQVSWNNISCNWKRIEAAAKAQQS